MCTLLCSGEGAVISCKGVRWAPGNLMCFESDTDPLQLPSWKALCKTFVQVTIYLSVSCVFTVAVLWINKE